MKGVLKGGFLMLVMALTVDTPAFSEKVTEPIFKKEIKDGVVHVPQPYTGDLVGYYENGRIKVRESYVEGILVGKVEYYENGEVLNSESYEENKKVLEEKESAKKATAMRTERAEDYKQYVTYYPNGNIKEKAVYKDKEIDGEYLSYYENGNLKEKGNYESGELDGVYISYYESGQMKIEKNYKAGDLQGDYTWYHENGQIKEKMIYSEGRPDGESISYYEGGELERSEYYRKGELLGETVYDKKGNIMFKEEYGNPLEEIQKIVNEELVMKDGKKE